MFLILLITSFFKISLAVESQELIDFKQSEEVRVKNIVNPVLEDVLKSQCGDHCPGFKIDVKFETPKLSPQDSEEQLGFSLAQKTLLQNNDVTPRVNGVHVSLLLNDKLEITERKSIEQIVKYKISNLVPYAVTTSSNKMPELKIPEEAPKTPEPKQAKADEVDKFRPNQLFWPATVLIALLIAGLFTLILLKKFEAMLFKFIDRISPKFLQDSNEKNFNDQAKFKKINEIIEEQPDNLRFAIDGFVRTNNTESLLRIRKIFSANSLIKHLDMSPSVLEAFAQLPKAAKSEINEDDLNWITSELDQSIWMRSLLEKDTLKKLELFSLSDMQSFIADLPIVEQAFVVSQISEEFWPSIISNLKSECRLQIGLLIAKFETTPADIHLKKSVEQKLKQFKPSIEKAPSLANYAFYLKESEANNLFSRLSSEESVLKHRIFDLNKAISGLSSEAIAELYLHMDLKDIACLQLILTEESYDYLKKQCPKTLLNRLQNQIPDKSEDNLLRVKVKTLKYIEQLRITNVVSK